LIQSKRVLAFLAGLKVKLKRQLAQMVLMTGTLLFDALRISSLIFSSVETGPGAIAPPSLEKPLDTIDPENSYRIHQLRTYSKPSTRKLDAVKKSNKFRLERFGKAMTGTGSWEVPGAVLNGKAEIFFLKYMR
jgi:hypothetical protein